MEASNDDFTAETLRNMRNSAGQSKMIQKPNDGGGQVVLPVSNEAIALQLLQSPDSRVAAAAKRIFSPAPSIDAKSRSESSNSAGAIGDSGLPMQSAPMALNTNINAVQDTSHSVNVDVNTHPQSQMTIKTEEKHSNNDAILEILANTATQLVQNSLQTDNEPKSNEVDTSFPIQNHLQEQVVSRIVASSSISNGKNGFGIDRVACASANSKATSRISNMTPKDRLHRRERNRMHARKTRQRKKEHMQNLQDEAEKLKKEQISLKLQINEKNTANILLVMCKNASSNDLDQSFSNAIPIDPDVEKLLQRDTKDIPDSSRIVELPALILPGQHRKRTYPYQNHQQSQSAQSDENKKALHKYDEELMEGIDYNLLCKDRSTCTSAELDLIRKERNRMHAKRTRDRKRIYMEEMKSLIDQLRTENNSLKIHMHSLTKNCKRQKQTGSILNPSPDTNPLSSTYNSITNPKPITSNGIVYNVNSNSDLNRN